MDQLAAMLNDSIIDAMSKVTGPGLLICNGLRLSSHTSICTLTLRTNPTRYDSELHTVTCKERLGSHNSGPQLPRVSFQL